MKYYGQNNQMDFQPNKNNEENCLTPQNDEFKDVIIILSGRHRIDEN